MSMSRSDWLVCMSGAEAGGVGQAKAASLSVAALPLWGASALSYQSSGTLVHCNVY